MDVTRRQMLASVMGTVPASSRDGDTVVHRVTEPNYSVTEEAGTASSTRINAGDTREILSIAAAPDGSEQGWVVRLDSNTDVVWSRTFPKESDASISAVGTDGDAFVFAGSKRAPSQ